MKSILTFRGLFVIFVGMLIGSIAISYSAAVEEQTKADATNYCPCCMMLGAKKADIAYQFLLEAVMISVSGGLVGVVLGSSIAVGVSELAEIPTILSFYSILLSFGVAVSIGVIFGYAPAKRAAEQDPITSLRYE